MFELSNCSPCRLEYSIDYNRGKKGIDIVDQLASYNSPAHKTCFWYKKIASDLVSVAVTNAILIYEDLYRNNKITMLTGHEIIITHPLEIQGLQWAGTWPAMN